MLHLEENNFLFFSRGGWDLFEVSAIIARWQGMLVDILNIYR